MASATFVPLRSRPFTMNRRGNGDRNSRIVAVSPVSFVTVTRQAGLSLLRIGNRFILYAWTAIGVTATTHINTDRRMKIRKKETNPARIPLRAFLIILIGSGFVLGLTPLAGSWLFFFVGLAPDKAIESGQPAFDTLKSPVTILIWGVFIASVYVALHIAGWRRHVQSYGWVAVALLLVSGLSGCARILHAISQIR